MTALGVQLYSVRDDIGPGRLDKTLRRLSAMGFTHAEPYDIVTDPRGLAAALRRNDLRATTAHAKITEFDQDEILDAAEILGVTTVIVPWVHPAVFTVRDRIERFAAAVNSAAEQAAKRGVRVGYHNHDFEFAQTVDGRPAYEVLVDLLDPAVVLEVDVYWAGVGGADVFDLLERLGDRVRFLHVVRDREPGNDRPVRGTDVTDRMPEVLAATAIELPVVEVVAHNSDVFPLLLRNAAYFRELVTT